MSWRLIKLETYNAFMNMAIDEAIFMARIANAVPNTLRFYRWNPSAVSVGKFQNAEKEVFLDNCREHGVDIVRRVTGGGAVYHDAEDEITYSVTVSKEDLKTENINTIYSKIYAGISEALKILDVNADFDEGNAKTCPNLTVHGKKISGSAQSHKKGVVLQHGTLLLDVDLEKMFTFLRVPWAKTCTEVLNVAERRITSLKREQGKTVSLDKACHALTAGFERALGIEVEDGELSGYERELADRLCKEKYSTTDWNLNGRSIYEEKEAKKYAKE
jgi:lipoate-protein ligase A